MTNHKFKDYRKNLIAYRVIVKNYEILCTILLTLNQQFPKTFYAKKMRGVDGDLRRKLPCGRRVGT